MKIGGRIRADAAAGSFFVSVAVEFIPATHCKESDELTVGSEVDCTFNSAGVLQLISAPIAAPPIAVDAAPEAPAERELAEPSLANTPKPATTSQSIVFPGRIVRLGSQSGLALIEFALIIEKHWQGDQLPHAGMPVTCELSVPGEIISVRPMTSTFTARGRIHWNMNSDSGFIPITLVAPRGIWVGAVPAANNMIVECTFDGQGKLAAVGAPGTIASEPVLAEVHTGKLIADPQANCIVVVVDHAFVPEGHWLSDHPWADGDVVSCDYDGYGNLLTARTLTSGPSLRGRVLAVEGAHFAVVKFGFDLVRLEPNQNWSELTPPKPQSAIDCAYDEAGNFIVLGPAQTVRLSHEGLKLRAGRVEQTVTPSETLVALHIPISEKEWRGAQPPQANDLVECSFADDGTLALAKPVPTAKVRRGRIVADVKSNDRLVAILYRFETPLVWRGDKNPKPGFVVDCQFDEKNELTHVTPAEAGHAKTGAKQGVLHTVTAEQGSLFIRHPLNISEVWRGVDDPETGSLVDCDVSADGELLAVKPIAKARTGRGQITEYHPDNGGNVSIEERFRTGDNFWVGTPAPEAGMKVACHFDEAGHLKNLRPVEATEPEKPETSQFCYGHVLRYSSVEGGIVSFDYGFTHEEHWIGSFDPSLRLGVDCSLGSKGELVSVVASPSLWSGVHIGLLRRGFVDQKPLKSYWERFDAEVEAAREVAQVKFKLSELLRLGIYGVLLVFVWLGRHIWPKLGARPGTVLVDYDFSENQHWKQTDQKLGEKRNVWCVFDTSNNLIGLYGVAPKRNLVRRLWHHILIKIGSREPDPKLVEPNEGEIAPAGSNRKLSGIILVRNRLVGVAYDFEKNKQWWSDDEPRRTIVDCEFDVHGTLLSVSPVPYPGTEKSWDYMPHWLAAMTAKGLDVAETAGRLGSILAVLGSLYLLFKNLLPTQLLAPVTCLAHLRHWDYSGGTVLGVQWLSAKTNLVHGTITTALFQSHWLTFERDIDSYATIFLIVITLINFVFAAVVYMWVSQHWRQSTFGRALNAIACGIIWSLIFNFCLFMLRPHICPECPPTGSLSICPAKVNSGQDVTLMQGQAATLTWSAENASDVEIVDVATMSKVVKHPQAVGALEIRPAHTTTYRMTLTPRFVTDKPAGKIGPVVREATAKIVSCVKPAELGTNTVVFFAFDKPVDGNPDGYQDPIDEAKWSGHEKAYDRFAWQYKQAAEWSARHSNTCPLVVTIAVGHTDAVGTNTYNDELSMRRAEIVERDLGARIWAATGQKPMFITSGVGKSDLAYKDQQGKFLLNRRVVICLTARESNGTVSQCPTEGRQ